METIFINTENCENNEQHKFVLNLPLILDFKSSNEKRCSSKLINLLYLEKSQTRRQEQKT